MLALLSLFVCATPPLVPSIHYSACLDTSQLVMCFACTLSSIICPSISLPHSLRVSLCRSSYLPDGFAKEIGTEDCGNERRSKFTAAMDVKDHIRKRMELGPRTTTMTVFHDGVDVARRKYLGLYLQHINLGIGGILPLQACAHQ